ncbi:ionotropic receptor 93a-like [Daphnia pulicaria]|uniref:ionotropic receptor 93a-like n=1 Tax=Daphnia pulicaria TaxID=35523 RepID=UPI001EEA2196|nr:ionotropic receptor 93a-like [Daphnia pulicaria]
MAFCSQLIQSFLIFSALLMINSANAEEVSLLKKTNPLNGKALMIIPVNMSDLVQYRFNDSRLKEYMPRTARMQIDIIDWLAIRYNFTYAILTTNETTLERPVNKANRGSLSFLLDGTCDMVLSDLFMTSGRYRLVDMPYPWYQGPARFLIPVPDASLNFASVLKPFQLPVWITLIVSVVLLIATFELIKCYLPLRDSNDSDIHDVTQCTSNKPIPYLYVFGLLLSQGGPIISMRLPIRLVAGIWCLAAFVLSQAYNSTLITYVIAPNNPPLINSVMDIISNPNIRLIVEKNMGLDVVISGSTDEDGIFRHLRDRINGYPTSRCIYQSECIERVISGGSHVFPKSIEYLLDAMFADFQKTGQCRLQIAKEGFMNFIISLALVKHSPYTNSISKGVIEMNQFGLIEHWIASYQAMPHQCLAQAAKKRRDETPRLSLKNLTGAFAVLVARRRLITIQRPVDSSHSTKQKASTSSGQYGPDEFVFW